MLNCCANKINKGSRVYRMFATIVGNVSRCTDLDIRELTIQELSLAVNLSTFRLSSASRVFSNLLRHFEFKVLSICKGQPDTSCLYSK